MSKQLDEKEQAWVRGFVCALATILRNSKGDDGTVAHVVFTGVTKEHIEQYATPYDVEPFKEYGII